MVQQRSFRQRNRRRAWAWPRPQNWFRVLLANRDMDPLWKLHFRVTRPTFLTRTWVVWNIRCFKLCLLKLLSCKKNDLLDTLAGSVAHSHLLEEMLDNTFITIYIDFSFLSLKSILTYNTVPSRNSHTPMST